MSENECTAFFQESIEGESFDISGETGRAQLADIIAARLAHALVMLDIYFNEEE